MQVVAGVNYKIYFTAECEDADPVDFEAAIFVPLYSNPGALHCTAHPNGCLPACACLAACLL